jgi:hypothetical protein
MEEFLTTPFPCGIRPCDKVKRLRVYTRCDDWLELAGWGDRNSEISDYGDGGPEEPEDDFNWKERRNNVYKPTFDKARRVSRIPFAAQPNITIVIVTPFDRFGAEKLELCVSCTTSLKPVWRPITISNGLVRQSHSQQCQLRRFKKSIRQRSLSQNTTSHGNMNWKSSSTKRYDRYILVHLECSVTDMSPGEECEEHSKLCLPK